MKQARNSIIDTYIDTRFGYQSDKHLRSQILLAVIPFAVVCGLLTALWQNKNVYAATESLEAQTKEVSMKALLTDAQVPNSGLQKFALTSDPQPESDPHAAHLTVDLVIDRVAQEHVPTEAFGQDSALSDFAVPCLPTLTSQVIHEELENRETLGIALDKHGIMPDEANRFISALSKELDMRSLRPGDVYELEVLSSSEAEKEDTVANKLLKLSYTPRISFGIPVTFSVHLDDDGNGNESCLVHRFEEKPITKAVEVSGTIQSSLYNTLLEQGEKAQLTNQFADLFGWTIDFYRDPQPGDTFKMIVEKEFLDGEHVGYGKVLAGEYINGGRRYRHFLFKSKDGEVHGTYNDEGDTSERLFLKSPMELTQITSSFGQRFHPVLKRRRMHNGVDYGAPRGTPFWSVANGKVVEARYSSSAGNMIRVQHDNGYMTEYFHAQKIAPGIKKGVRVKQRQVIGYVGSTGRSTGPHLHFGMKKKGKYVDPRRQKFPGGSPMPKAYRAEYFKHIKPLMEQFDAQ